MANCIECDRLRSALQEARSALVSTTPILRKSGYLLVARHVEDVIAECSALLPANHPDAFSRVRDAFEQEPPADAPKLSEDEIAKTERGLEDLRKGRLK